MVSLIAPTKMSSPLQKIKTNKDYFYIHSYFTQQLAHIYSYINNKNHIIIVDLGNKKHTFTISKNKMHMQFQFIS